MMFSKAALITAIGLSFLVPSLAASKIAECSLLGPDVPTPRHPSRTSVFQIATMTLKRALDAACFLDHEEDSMFEYHHAAPVLSNSTSSVVNSLLTVYTFLVAAGDIPFNEPVTNYNPVGDGSLSVFDWSSITIGMLATGSADYNTTLRHDKLGLPLPNIPPVPTYTNNSNCTDSLLAPCTRERFFKTSQPVYSNTAYSILAYTLESLTNESFQTLFETQFIEPLQLNSIRYSSASMERDPTGSYLSSINDMQRISRSILNSKLLSKAPTNRWLKPTSFTGNPNMAVGAPWEIYKAPLEHKTSWMYTKDGDIGFFTVFAAGDDVGGLQYALPNLVAEIIVPAIDKAAKEGANRVFSGSYHLGNGTNDTLSIDVDDHPGLKVTEWIVNGRDIIKPYLGADGEGEVRLFASGLESKKGTKIGFKLVTRKPEFSSAPITRNCIDWSFVSVDPYSGIFLGDWVVELNEERTGAVKVEPRAFRMSFSRT
ncbi:beta-lactamase [Halenospora varia]|nr:beta-lactamase [Halenospora varia]